MKIKYATVVVRIGEPFNQTIPYTFKVKDGQGYIAQGMAIGRYLQMRFVEDHFDKPTKKDYKNIENISEIKVNRFR